MNKRKVPPLKTDEEAEAFLEQDLSDLDFTQFKPVKFEFLAKDKSINLRLPEGLLKAVQTTAKRQGIPYQRFIRLTLERAVAGKR
jgi:predicted DNA binding CopG/RHH family protein